MPFRPLPGRLYNPGNPLLSQASSQLNQVHVENRSSGPPFGKQATPPAPLPKGVREASPEETGSRNRLQSPSPWERDLG